MRYASIPALVLVLSVVGAIPPRADEPAAQEDPLADKVHKAIDRAVKYLRDQEQQTQGRLERNIAGIIRLPEGGMTALGVLSLLYAGVPPEDEMIHRCLKYLRSIDPKAGGQTYVVSLQTMVYALANQPEDTERIQACVDWLIEARLIRNGKLTGWTYTKTGGNAPADNSNTQYALLGLHEGFQAGAKIEPEVWEQIHDFYVGTMVKTRTSNGEDAGA